MTGLRIPIRLSWDRCVRKHQRVPADIADFSVRDLEMLLREQQLMLDELRELELARQEVKERRKIVHAKRRDRLRKKAQNDSARQLAFFSGRA